MARHSKNSTTRPFFTYHERRELGYGTQRQRLGTESMRPFDACCLCLKPSSNPVLTHHGYIYCRECILENVLNQKKQIKKAKKLYELQLKEQEQEEKLKQIQKQQDEVHKFESLVEGIPLSDQPLQSPQQHQKNNESDRRGGAFWVPALAPESTKMTTLPQKFDKKIYDPMCHKAIKAKELITLHFRMAAQTNGGDSIEYNSRFMCGCCLKTLTNSTKGAHCIVECGHVSCGNCYQKFVQPVLKKRKKSQRDKSKTETDKSLSSSSSSGDTSSRADNQTNLEQNVDTSSSIPQCLECAQRILRKPIEIQIAGTGFTQEGKLNEATKYAPSLGFA